MNGDTFTFTESTAATISSPVGSYAIVPVATGTNLANYTVVYANGTLSIGQATLTVTAGNASRAYGVANPSFSASAVGAVGGDTFTFTESTTATTTSPVGSYPIVPVATGANLANYTVVYANGTLTIGQATLTVTAGNASRAYGSPRTRASRRPLSAPWAATPSPSPRAPRPRPPRRSAATRSFRSRPARTWPTTPWSTPTAP